MAPRKRAAAEGDEDNKMVTEPRRSSRISSKPPSQVTTDTKNASSSSKPASNAKPKASSKQPPKKKSKSNEVEKVAEEGQEEEELKGLEVGEFIPDGIKLENEAGEEVEIKEGLLKEKGAIFFLYPKANTPGCTNQACGFRDLYSEITDLGWQVFGLSMDKPNAQKSWKEKQSLQYHLLCDPSQSLIKPLGASKSPTSTQRSHFVIGKGGKILDIKLPATPKDGPKLALDFVKTVGPAN